MKAKTSFIFAFTASLFIGGLSADFSNHADQQGNQSNCPQFYCPQMSYQQHCNPLPCCPQAQPCQMQGGYPHNCFYHSCCPQPCCAQPCHPQQCSAQPCAPQMRCPEPCNAQRFCPPDCETNECCVDDCDACGKFFVRADYFYWKTCADGLAIALQRQETTKNEKVTIGPESGANLAAGEFPGDVTVAAHVREKVRLPSDEWESGFRVGFGYRPHDSGYDVALNWINFEPSATKHIIVDENAFEQGINLVPFNGSALVPFLSNIIVPYPFVTTTPAPQAFAMDLAANIAFGQSVRSKWNLNMNLIDLEFGRAFHCGCISFRPHVDVRCGSIEQHMTTRTEGVLVPRLYNTESTTTGSSLGSPSGHFRVHQKLRNEFWGVGPRAGFDFRWNTGCSWGIYGNLAASLLYGDRETHHRELAARFESTLSEVDSENFYFKRNNCKRCTRAITDTAIGLYYATDYCTSSSDYDLMLKLGWEHHYFFNQGIADASRDTGLFGEENSDLSTQGLVVTAGVGF